MNENINFKSILESISDGIFTIDLEWKITYFNSAAEVITGISRKEAVGRKCSDVFHSSICEKDCVLKKTFENNKPIIGKTVFIIDNDGEKIPISVSTAILRDKNGDIIGGAETFRDLTEIEILRDKLEDKAVLDGMIAKSPSMNSIVSMISSIAKSPVTTLIYGETGTGKEVLAKKIHELSERKDFPFIAINCGALPDTLLESELFGYKKGAFTGALKDKPGKFKLAENGTLFLDEIGEISPALQIRLLRVLQEHTYEPLGAVKTESTNARIIAATNKDLQKLVEKGSFRRDLFYRINVINLNIPPLRERKEDILLLIQHFIRKINKVHKKIIKGFTKDALDILMEYKWPGNIRELENVIERAFVLCTSEYIDISYLPSNITKMYVRKRKNNNINDARRDVEKNMIMEVLDKNDYNLILTSKELGIHRSTLYRKMKKFGIISRK